MMRTALITGIAGQDGAYLAKELLNHNYRVIGTKLQRHSASNLKFLGIRNDVELTHLDITDKVHIFKAIETYAPDEIYNLAASSFIQQSWENPDIVIDNNSKPVLYFLEALREINANIRLYQASSSEIYGKNPIPADIDSILFNPSNPYAAAKLMAHNLVKIFRNSFNLYAVSGILFNHESPIRPEKYVTRKIVKAAVEISFNKSGRLELGSLDVRRDWGYAGDFTRAMYLMMQNDLPKDYVICTGELHTVREICEIAFNYFNLDYRNFVETNPAFFRPADNEYLIGDPSKAIKELGWKPTLTFDELILHMLECEIRSFKLKKAELAD